MTQAAFQEAFGVSRETLERLAVYADLLARWNARINLVGRSTLSDVWTRHFADSAQLLRFAPPEPTLWVDIGSGGGLPGLVVAALLKERGDGRIVRLIESDVRKCAFLAEAARAMQLDVEIDPVRIEQASPKEADIVSARALAPLDRLLELATRFCGATTTLLLPKGRMARSELTEAERSWHIDARLHPSLTDPAAVIIEVRRFHRRRPES